MTSDIPPLTPVERVLTDRIRELEAALAKAQAAEPIGYVSPPGIEYLGSRQSTHIYPSPSFNHDIPVFLTAPPASGLVEALTYMMTVGTTPDAMTKARAALAAARDALKEALEQIAKQRLAKEMTLEFIDDVDWHGGYEACVECARAALAAAKEDKP